MTQLIDPTPPSASAEPDLVAAIQRVLAASSEPMTLSKLRARLPASHRQMSLEELAGILQRQVAANVLYQYPKYRSPQDRFWDRPMPIHLAALLRETLEEKPLAWPQLRRKLPPYALGQAEAVLEQELARGTLHRHPPTTRRGGDRFGVRPPDPKEYLRQDLPEVFQRLSRLGFQPDQIRAAALELLHEEEWMTVPSEATDEADTGREPMSSPREPSGHEPSTPPASRPETHGNPMA
jgi:hypothetical protein